MKTDDEKGNRTKANLAACVLRHINSLLTAGFYEEAVKMVRALEMEARAVAERGNSNAI